MQNILKSCEPRKDILTGTFNPEIFTASLAEVIRYYQADQAGVHSIYTDAVQFFTEGTYATDGMKTVLNEVFARLAGDGTAPAIHRLETAFGGGKTHTLIACTHIGYKGNEITPHISQLMEPKWIPRKGEVHVVGIAGNEIPVHKPKGTKLIPYTLWGEIAFQMGGEELYRLVEDDAEAYAAPGKNYYDSVFEGRKALVMIDELAQYAARLAAAKADGSEQLAAFLMGLHDYARTHSGISVVLTLAGTTDAFAKQTSNLAKLLSSITGKEIDADDALGIGQQAVAGIASVVSRDATSVIPVQASEISRVLAKRLFIKIDESVAKETADSYREMYRKNSSLLPDEATRDDFYDRMVSHYPFHPTFIDFLNHKLASYENFQGTRGILRILALAVRTLWEKKSEIPMIHTCHLDLRDARTTNEVIGRSGSGDLLPVLNADIGGADTAGISGGRSNAELADRKNPHPEGWPLYEYTWKTVFLHSLVGRAHGLGSSIFGLTEQDAMFETSFPGLTPPQVAEALKEISNSAFYLRFNQGRYYASLDPSVNIALAKLRRGFQRPAIDALLDATARKVVTSEVSPFDIVADVTAPEHIPDKKGKPSLALIALKAEPIKIDEFITTAGPNRPRIEQNLVFLLVPDTVEVKVGPRQQELKFGTPTTASEENRRKLDELARTVLAMRDLKKNSENYGINPRKLEEDEFKQRHSERENALISTVTESYRNLWYPSANGQIVCREIRTSGGESGTPVMAQIRKALYDDGELVTGDFTTQSALMSLTKLFFSQHDIVEISKLKENFCRIRNWPILESPDVFDQLIRAGVSRGTWCLFRMGSEETTLPDEFYSRETGELPFDVDIHKGYSLVTSEGAKKRGWGKPDKPDSRRVQDWVRDITREMPEAKISQISEKIGARYGDVPEKEVQEAISKLVQESRIMAYKGDPGQREKPDLIAGSRGALYMPESEDVIITPARASEKGWIEKEDNTIRLSGKEGAKTIMPMLRRVGPIYDRGGKSRIDMLDITDMELPNGGTLRITIENTPPESVKDLGELFEVIDNLVQSGEQTECHLTINHPETDCPFIRALRPNSKQL